MRDMSHFTFVTGSVGLNPSEVALAESGRLRVLAQKKLIGAIHILHTSPEIVAIEKSQG